MKSVAIVLNGASSAGKTSIARAMQELAKTPMLHAGLDAFTDMFHWTAIADEFTQKECHRVGVSNFHAVLPILASNRFTIVVDHVFEQHSWFEACRDALQANRTYFIGVHCPLTLLEKRERERGNRRIGLSRWQFERVHEHKPYDLEVHTEEWSAAECAAAILRFVETAKPTS